MEAIRHGFSVYFVSLPDLLDRLVQAQAENRMRRKMAHLRKCRLLILDEIGYRSLDRQATTCLFQLISERYERGSMILTSHKSYGEWGSIFQDNVIASAIVDRLLHHSHTLNIKGESYRLKEKRKAGVWTQPTADPAISGGGAGCRHSYQQPVYGKDPPVGSPPAWRCPPPCPCSPRRLSSCISSCVLCLNVDRHSARRVWEPMELANLLDRDCQSVTDSLRELCRRGVCIQRTSAAGRFTKDRVSVEICDRFWPYEKPPAEEFGIDQDNYVQQVRQMLLRPACVRSNFSAADERLAALLYRRGVTLIQVQRAIWLGCARKYASLLNADEYAPRLISSLHYFSVLVEEVSDTPAGEDYGRHIAHRAFQFEKMWKDRAQSQAGNPSQKDETMETK